ncbi:LytR/AlgR family response regulator transcription factor [Mucilaginibacter terrae]|uniref:LytR/AlgR family response regulator transcription factor n=1 Tax=Mucilaginibacter terrae TaxID=1955052 RepID=UPI00363E29D6
MRAIAIDDEPVALDIIKAHALKVPFIQLQGTFLSATRALAYLKVNSVDVVFLDISMPDVSGLEFAAMLQPGTQVIFTTAHPEHALKGYELAITDYLLKPVNFARFLQACQLAETRQLLVSTHKPATEESLFVKDGHNWLQIKLCNLLYAQADDNYVSLYETGKRTLTRMTFTELQAKLPVQQFMRIHKSYIIALTKIEKIEKHQVTVNGICIPLSKLYREELLGVLNR